MILPIIALSLTALSLFIGQKIDAKNGFKYSGLECWVTGTLFGILSGFCLGCFLFYLRN